MLCSDAIALAWLKGVIRSRRNQRINKGTAWEEPFGRTPCAPTEMRERPTTFNHTPG